MAITYNSFPSLLFTSYTRENAPDELPFEAASTRDRDYLAVTPGVRELIPAIAIFNTLGKSPTNYWLNDRQFMAVDQDTRFRNSHFQSFLSKPHGLQYGVISFKQGGQYLYVLMDKELSKGVKNIEGQYIAVCLMIKNLFVGFEEGILLPGRMNPMPGGRYNAGMDVAGYISFVTIALNYMEGANTPAPDNRTNEAIWSKK